MSTIAEVEKLALDLPVSQRAVLAAHLLRSLPPVLHDEDDGIAEALRRDAEFDANPDTGISLEQLDQQIASKRRDVTRLREALGESRRERGAREVGGRQTPHDC